MVGRVAGQLPGDCGAGASSEAGRGKTLGQPRLVTGALGPGVLIAVAPALGDPLSLPAVPAGSSFVRRSDELFDPLLKSDRDG